MRLKIFYLILLLIALVSSLPTAQAQAPITSDTAYILTTISLAPAHSQLLTTQTGEGLLLMGQPSPETGPTYWQFTPAAGGYYRLSKYGQAENLSYDLNLVAVEPVEDEAQYWQLTPAADGAYRITNKALGEARSLAVVEISQAGEGVGQVAFVDTAATPDQFWTLTPAATPPPLPTASPAAAPAAPETPLITFEDFGVWQRGDQPRGEFSQSQTRVKSGQSAGKLRYNFSRATGKEFVIFEQKTTVDGQPNQISVWVYGAGSGHFLNIWLIDAQGERWSVGLGRINKIGWQRLQGFIDAQRPWPSGPIDGPANGKIDYPLQFDGLVLDRVDGPLSGEIYVDDVSFQTVQRPPSTPKSGAQSAPRPDPVATAALAPTTNSFAPAEAATTLTFETFGAWKASPDHPYGQFIPSAEQTQAGQQAGQLTYDFSQAGANDLVIFEQKTPVAGQPNLITGWVYGDGSGHMLNVWVLDSAGEMWSMALGVVGEPGWQQLSGAIDPQRPWPSGHIYGPQNGAIDYPIQFSSLILDRADGSQTGTIYLDNLSFQTGAAPAAAPEPAAADDSAGLAATPEPATANSTNSYSLIPLEGKRDSRAAADHADLNLNLRGLAPIKAELELVEVKGDTDPYAPNLASIFAPNFVQVYTTHNWDWACNCPTDEINNPWGKVGAVELAVTPGQPIYIPPRRFDIYQGKYYATLLYASEDSLTFVYLREGIISHGYTVHYKELQTDPDLVALYRQSEGDELPGLTLDTPVGTATGDKLLVAIRDRGAFMDVRARKDWWVHDPDLPTHITENVAPAPVRDSQPVTATPPVSATGAAIPAHPTLQNGSFDAYQPFMYEGEAKAWKEESFPEQYGADWTLQLISQGKSRLHMLDSGTFGLFTQKYFNGGGRDYHIEGDHSQVVTSRYSFDLVLMQTVAATPGQEYTFSGSIVSFYKGTSGERADGKVFKTLGIDPTGGNDWRSEAVIWGERDGKDNEWRYPAVKATAQGQAITVFIQLENTEADVGQAELNTIHLDGFNLN